MKTDRNWSDLIACLPPGLTFSEAAARLGTDYQATRNAIKRYGYKAADGRKFSQNGRRKLVPENVNWKLSNIEIARRLKISRERVRFMRAQLNKPFVESRGRKPRKPTKAHA